ncbi:hypothetical protein ACFOY2_27640 [Nonomuraea purpurea]|uniref:Uncharacterized protein n=1 Tax=Nonomuraea purpurea TaxID=1849276 RepID=A0ABV8GAP4_9ACTN
MTQDAVGQALIQAFADQGYPVRFIGPTNVSISLPGGSDFTADIGEWYAEASRIPRADLPAAAAEFAGGFARGFRRQAAQAQAVTADIEGLLDAEALRVRIYPEAALAEPPGLRESLLTRPLAAGLVETVVIDTPDSIIPLNRRDIGDRPESQVFGAALHASLNREPHYTQTEEIWGVPITHIGETHRYVGSHVHVLGRYLGAAPYGALVSFPLPEYLVVHEIGGTHLVAAMEAMQALARTHVEKGDNAISSQLYWWRPGAYEQQPERDALAGGQVPDLRPVGVEVDHQEKSIAPLTAETEELLNLWMRDQG